MLGASGGKGQGLVRETGSRAGAAVLLALAFVCRLSIAAGPDWREERWVVEDFTKALGGGPEGGPVAQAGGEVHALCGDQEGRLFLASGQFIDIVTPDGRRTHLAGSGEPGYRDGPAYQAQFRLGFNAYYGAHNIACGPNGVFVADGGNRAVRRIHKRDGVWQVDTWAGGGVRRDGTGDSVGSKDVRFNGTISVAVTPNGEVTVADDGGYFRVSADGKSVRYLGPWPKSMARSPDRPPKLNVMMGDADSRGNVYFVSRTPDFVVRIDPDGTATHLAGRFVEIATRLSIGDGPPREAFFDTPTSIAVQPDGSAAYVCGGDEYDIRRVPADGTGTTATLMNNGRWGIASIHPNRSRGAAVVKPNAKGQLRPDGDMTDLMVSHLLGRDAQGNLYGAINVWTGMTQYVEGQGLLGTRLFRLRRESPRGHP
ncbi:MAG TPA: hypothetical protein VJ673_02225 [Aromatoleum sp.]|uniref:hypothetical protein n=1 Tax=Aromatoleum sp. TaxID=2307007 RepID=UPI002B4907F4|nr:hypothetical protein [Aromatoleum sp.]HJV24467.1 hypothetical protein [Aromatoleum sp.]